jgi:hypothetical protein
MLNVPTAHPASFCQPVSVTATVTGLQSSPAAANQYDYYAQWPLTPLENEQACVSTTHAAP